MSSYKEAPVVKRRSKGEQSRNAILEAAIELLAMQGIKGTTHRAIANHANLQLSLTTYYFKDINELIIQAFQLNSEKTIAQAGLAWQQAFDLVLQFQLAEVEGKASKAVFKESLTQLAIEYLVNKIQHQSTMLAVEQLLFTQVRTTPELQKVAHEHRAALLTPFTKLCRFFNPDNAEVNAEIMFTVFTQLEYRNIAEHSGELNIKQIKATVDRIIEWIMLAK